MLEILEVRNDSMPSIHVSCVMYINYDIYEEKCLRRSKYEYSQNDEREKMPHPVFKKKTKKEETFNRQFEEKIGDAKKHFVCDNSW